MSSEPTELLRAFVKSQRFTSTAEVMEAMKDMFRDVIQQVMEVELEDELGYEKSDVNAKIKCTKRGCGHFFGLAHATKPILRL